MRKLTYKEKFIQMDREAAATAICAVVILKEAECGEYSLVGYLTI